MNKIWILARKDIREAFRSRSTYIYIAVLFLLTFSYLSTYTALVNRLLEQNAGQDAIHQASQIFLNSLAYTLPLMYSILICSIFAAYSVIVDKAKHNLDSLMATPVSLKKIWIAKSLAVTLPSVLIALAVSIVGYIAINIMRVVPLAGGFIVPDPAAIISAFILVPVLILAVVLIVVYLQLILPNPRIANLAFTGIFLLLFFGATALTSMGLNVDFSLIYLGLIAVFLVIAYFLSPSLTRERVLLSSKG